MIGKIISLLAVVLSIVPALLGNNYKGTEVIHDFAGNDFILIEGDQSYKIYTDDNLFIEGSYTSNSPYFNESGEKYYLGPGNYFICDDNVVTDLFTNENFALDDLINYSYEISPSIETRSSEITPDTDRTYTDTEGFTVINEADYFRNLTYFPMNWFGECGVIALSELLGYYDTFYNDDFIPNDATYDARYYVKKTSTLSNESSEYELDRTETEPLVKTVTTTYKNVDEYSFEDWSTMPGTTYAMRDYIFDNYMETFRGIGWPNGGYPMLDGELRDTLKNYMEDNCSDLIDDTEFRNGSIFYTHQRRKEYLAEGLPTLLVLKSYDSSVGDGVNHVVVAYGYQDDKFLCHFGWTPGSKKNAEVILCSATIYGYFTIKYNGEHKHSSNVSMTRGNKTKYICGCGDVHDSD